MGNVRTLRDNASAYFRELQQEICSSLETIDGKEQFGEDRWTHTDGGGGVTRIIEAGNVFEKGGVNFSAVEGVLGHLLAERLQTVKQRFFATGVSLVLHPVSPMIPTVHLNLRYLELENGDLWFGGGTDLTPYYFFEEDTVHFHSVLKTVCDQHDRSFYPRFKKWCDEYFFLKHRNETRGVGGIFFDYLRENPDTTFAFVRDVGKAFGEAYFPIVEKRKSVSWSDGEKHWQLLRRGRYVEFNLVYDRGTLFGLETGGRIDSILMSLPPAAAWEYSAVPPPRSREAQLIEILQRPRNWIP